MVNGAGGSKRKNAGTLSHRWVTGDMTLRSDRAAFGSGAKIPIAAQGARGSTRRAARSRSWRRAAFARVRPVWRVNPDLWQAPEGRRRTVGMLRRPRLRRLGAQKRRQPAPSRGDLLDALGGARLERFPCSPGVSTPGLPRRTAFRP
jgi:hypothetical protein